MIFFKYPHREDRDSLAVLGFSRPFFLRHLAPLSLAEFIHVLKLSVNDDFLESVDKGKFDFLQDHLGVRVKTKIEAFAKAQYALEKYNNRFAVENVSLEKHLGFSVEGNLATKNKLPSFFLRHVHCGAEDDFFSLENLSADTTATSESFDIDSNHLPDVEALMQTLEGKKQFLVSASYIRQNLRKLIAEHNLLLLSRFFSDYRERSQEVWMHKNASVHETVVANGNSFTLVGEEARVGPFVYLAGVNCIGGQTMVKPGSMLNDVSLGHCCRIGGEMTSTSIDDYTNKTHHGFMGHTIVGSWVNIGAGTTFSNLKSTYGKSSDDKGKTTKKKQDDGNEELFLGSIVGDYAKLGINSSVFQKKTIGVGASVFGNIYRSVPHFHFSQNNFNNETESTVKATQLNRWYKSSFVKTQQRMMARRGLSLAKDEETFLSKLHDALSDRPIAE